MNRRFWRKISFQNLDASTLLLSWTEVVSPKILEEILAVERSLKQSAISGIWETFHGYASLAIHFDQTITSSQSLIKSLKELNIKKIELQKPETWVLPVCYDSSLASDLLHFSKQVNLPHEEVVHRHSAPEYLVYMMGFLPGFMYLGGLDEKLHCPRKATPSRQIAQGDVAIGGAQTGIYPMESPGGWHVIGNCPVPLFDPRSTPPCLIEAGDKIKFRPICSEEHAIIKIQLSTGVFNFNDLRHG